MKPSGPREVDGVVPVDLASVDLASVDLHPSGAQVLADRTASVDLHPSGAQVLADQTASVDLHRKSAGRRTIVDPTNSVDPMTHVVVRKTIVAVQLTNRQIVPGRVAEGATRQSMPTHSIRCSVWMIRANRSAANFWPTKS